jgi:SAM-dependent methyltransferase
VLNGAAVAQMTSIGHRVGLFDAMSKLPAATSAEIAAATGLSERYVREWLGAMVTGGIVEFQPTDKRYTLPAEHAAFLTRAASPNNLAVTSQWFAVLGSVEGRVVEAFRHGKGVPYSAYERFHEVMAEESSQTVVAGLCEHIIPLVSGLTERLAAGIDVVDVGCGSGQAMIHLAERFANSRFTGLDASPEAVAAAVAEAGRRKLSNVRFEVQDAATWNATDKYDLITTFDAIHDQAKPAVVLGNIAKALRRDGVYLMQEISGSGNLHSDIGHPFGPLLYTVSCMHCMSVSLANGGPGLGAMWGKQLAQSMLAEAGFRQVEIKSLDHDPLNFWFIARLGM